MAFFIFNRHTTKGFMRTNLSVYFLSFFLTVLLGSCTESTLFRAVPSTSSGINFENRIIETETFNILTEEYIFNGGGVAVADFNKDGLPDLFFSGNQVSNALYLNQGDLNFTDVSMASGVASTERWFTGVLILDVNNDSWPDIYVAAGIDDDPIKRQNALFVHKGLNEQGIPVFEEQAEAYGIADRHSSMWAATLDYNRDGLIDLYVLNNEQTGILPTNYREKVLDGSAESNDRLYRNNGDGSFTDVTLEAGIVYEGFGLGVVVSDFNYDGYDDLYVTNDYLSNDLLYINDTKGSFINEIGSRLKHQSKFSMGVDVSDLNNDGLLDILSVDMLAETNQRMKTTVMGVNYISEVYNKRWGYEPQYMRNMLHMGNGKNVPFSEVGLLAGVAQTDWSWSPLMVDMDNDGYRDVLITNGFPRDVTDMDFSNYRLEFGQYASTKMILDSVPIIKIPNYAYRNKGDLQFEDVGESWGLNIASFSNGAVYSDLDLDGDLDYVVNNINDKAFLFENTAADRYKENKYIQVELKGSSTNYFGIGAKIVIENGAQRLYSEQRLGRGYMSSVDPVLHFGLGAETSLLKVHVVWPDQKWQTISGVTSNQRITLNYSDAVTGSFDLEGLLWGNDNAAPLLQSANESQKVHLVHEEADIIDFSAQPLLPYKISQQGPVLAKGDFNQDGLEDFIVGSSASHAPVLFLQQPNGEFSSAELYSQEDKVSRLREEAAIAVLDVDNDGDLDLVMISGGADYKAPTSAFDHVLLLNDGSANFSPNEQLMPALNFNGSSAVAAADFNNDGRTDLFIGGGVLPGEYPLSSKSMLLMNTAQGMVDVTETYLSELGDLSMLKDAKWIDINNDGLLDLVLAAHFQPIKIFLNNANGPFSLMKSSLDQYLGWFNTLAFGDFNEDGFIDILAGNLGANNFYGASEQRPVTLLAKDFDANGKIDPILFAYFKDNERLYRQFPVAFWGDINKQSPIFRAKFSLYAEYGMATYESLFTEEERDRALSYTMNFDRSALFLSLQGKDFEMIELPIEAQVAPVNDMLVDDVNEDGHLDVLLVGNNYANEVFIGHLDALNGLLLVGDGTGKLNAVSTPSSGFLVPRDAKRIEQINLATKERLYITTQNRDSLLLFKRR